MAKAQAKTTENSNSVAAFIKKLGDPERQKDANAIITIMQDQSGFEAENVGPGNYWVRQLSLCIRKRPRRRCTPGGILSTKNRILIVPVFAI